MSATIGPMPKLESQSEKEKMSSVSASSSTESTAIVDEISRASQNNNTDGQSRSTHVAVEETLFFAVAPLRTSPLVEMTSSEKIKAYCNEGGPLLLSTAQRWNQLRAARLRSIYNNRLRKERKEAASESSGGDSLDFETFYGGGGGCVAEKEAAMSKSTHSRSWSDDDLPLSSSPLSSSRPFKQRRVQRGSFALGSEHHHRKREGKEKETKRTKRGSSKAKKKKKKKSSGGTTTTTSSSSSSKVSRSPAKKGKADLPHRNAADTGTIAFRKDRHRFYARLPTWIHVGRPPIPKNGYREYDKAYQALRESVGIFPSSCGKGYVIRERRLYRKLGNSSARVEVEGAKEDMLYAVPDVVDERGRFLLFADCDSAWTALKSLFTKGKIGPGCRASSQEIVACVKGMQSVTLIDADDT